MIKAKPQHPDNGNESAMEPASPSSPGAPAPEATPEPEEEPVEATAVRRRSIVPQEEEDDDEGGGAQVVEPTLVRRTISGSLALDAGVDDEDDQPQMESTAVRSALAPTAYSPHRAEEPSAPELEPTAGARRELPEVARESYAVLGELARGGLGRILQARDTRLDRPVALKELLQTDGDAHARFVFEAFITARLQHPSIIPVYEAGRWPSGEPFFAMKLVSGRSLEAVVAETRTLDERLALLPHVIAVAEAMAYAHTERIIHRDLKPANVLVGDFGETVVIDWGLAKDLSRQEAGEPGPTRPGAVVGTPSYMAPEQALGHAVDERADVYSLGAILYHVLGGAPPYGVGGPSSAAWVLKQVMQGPPTPLEQKQPGLPPELLAFVSRAMARDPAERYRTARELADDLRRFQRGPLVAAQPAPQREPPPRVGVSPKALLAVVAAVVLVVGVLGALGARVLLRERDRANREQAAATMARREATERAAALALDRARAAVEQDPNGAVAWLRALSPDFKAWSAARTLAADARARGLATLLRGHAGAVNALAFTPDGQSLVTAGSDHALRVWNLKDGTSRVLNGHAGEVLRVAISPDGRALASGGQDGAVRLWDLTSGTGRELAGHQGAVSGLAFSADGHLVSTGFDGVLRTQDVATAEAFAFPKQPEKLTALALSPDGRLAATAMQRDKSVRLWDLKTGDVRILEGHQDAVTQVVFSPRGDLLATGSRDQSVRLWSAQAGTGRVLGERLGTLSALAFSPDGRRVAAGIGQGLTVRVWNVDTGEARELKGHQGRVTGLAFSADGVLIASASLDRTVRVWTLETGEVRVLRGAGDDVHVLAFAPDGRSLAVAGADGIVRLYPSRAQPSRALEGPRSSLAVVAIAPDGQHVAAGGDDGTLRVWSVTGGAPLLVRAHQGPVVAAAFSPDSQWLASTGADAAVRLWHPDGRAGPVLGGSARPGGLALAFAPVGAVLASAGESGAVHVYDLSTGEERILEGHKGRVRALAFSADGQQLASGGDDRTARVWNLATGEGRILSGHEDAVRTVAFSPDGRTLATGGAEPTARLWDLATGQARTLDTGGNVNQVLFSQDGGTVLTVSALQDDVRVWDAKSGAQRGTLRGHLNQIQGVALSQDGTRLVSAGADRVARIWDLATGESRALPHGEPVRAVAFSADGTFAVSAGEDGVVRIWPDDLPSDPSALRAWLDTVDTPAALRAAAGSRE